MKNQPRSPRGRRDGGHTLIEVSIASAFLTVGALGLVPLLVTGNQGLSSSSKIIEASSLAESKLAELVTLDYGAAALAAGDYVEAKNLTITGLPTAGANGCDAASDGGFGRSWTITDVEVPSGFNNAKEIAVTVCWWDKVGKQTRSVSTVGGIARPR